ncbi:MAG: tail fiber domain-containing protein [Betaproteobacteria bacterium]|jgi:hypothetical protein|nr:tail fiber domain-containing protein [Betaproteobacteria bacterium]
MNRRHSRIAGALLLAASLPAYSQTCAPFADVPAAHPFCADIQWMFNRGVTNGCASGLFCPGDPTPREQMAAFLHRLADALFPLTCATGQVMKWNGATWACAADATGAANAFLQGGNAFGSPALLGTTDTQPLDFRVHGARALRLEPNATSPNVVGGHANNQAVAGVRGAAVAGGGVADASDPFYPNGARNRVTDHYGFVGGGFGNQAGDDGFVDDAPFATAGGGQLNVAAGAYATVAGGRRNEARDYGVVGGGYLNEATGDESTVAGGRENAATGNGAAVGGGFDNVAGGLRATIPGGAGNTAAGDHAVALGHNADATANGCFVFSDASSPTDRTPCTAANAFVARAKGGFSLITGGTQGAYTGALLAAGSGSWSILSDRAAKENLEPVDADAILERVAALPIATWNWREQGPQIRHVGPAAQDVHAAFGVGESERAISAVDADGIALAAIQGLHRALAAKERRIAALEARVAEVDALRAEMEALRAALTRR